MSFKSRDLMFGILPAGNPFGCAQPGLGLCTQATADQEDDEDDKDDLECPQATAPKNGAFLRTGEDLTRLRQQLRRALAAETRH